MVTVAVTGAVAACATTAGPEEVGGGGGGADEVGVAIVLAFADNGALQIIRRSAWAANGRECRYQGWSAIKYLNFPPRLCPPHARI